MYPALTYVVTGHVAWLFGLENDLPHAFMIMAVFTHLALALGTTALSARVAPRPVAVIIGLFWLVDSGAISHGGTVGQFQWAILHSAFAHVFSLIAALAILSALERPRLGASVTIWVATAISTAAHPAALITAATYGLGLVAVALLAGDVRPRRAIVALGHLDIGVALGACVWMPAAERILEYGQPFSNELFSGVHALQIIMQYAMPISAYSLFIYGGYLAIIVGPWTRRAEVIFISVVSFALVIGLCDETYTSLGLAPSHAVARLGAIRMLMLAPPFMFAGGAWAIGALVRHARSAWTPAPRRQRIVAAALLSALVLVFARVVPEYWAAETDRAISEADHLYPDHQGVTALEGWAADQAAQLAPDRFGRALFITDTHEHMHLTARTGLPSFHMSAIPDLLLRERIEDTSPASLARFDVRWVILHGESPTIGDPSTERTFGNFHVREVRDWDGKFARIERGTGTVTTTRLDDDTVEIEVTGTSQPVLVALGMGYYPRWRAHHADGTPEPVYALPTIEGGSLHVVSAWVKPGRTIFTCDGPLPSDGKGRFLSLFAALVAIAGTLVWTRNRWRMRTLREIVRLRRRAHPVVLRVAELAPAIVVVALIVLGIFQTQSPNKAILVGTSGVRPVATVEARVGGDAWEECPFSPTTGVYRCEGIVNVSDGTVNLLNDASPSWPFLTPAIIATAETEDVELRITRHMRLGGTYWAGSTKSTVTIAADNDFHHEFSTRTALDIPRGSYTITLATRVPNNAATAISIVQESALNPPRTYLVPPPDVAPALGAASGRD
jgi:hypothetical protein